MRLPIIKHLLSYSDERDIDYLVETAETLEALTELESLKDQELDVIGEIISNIYGAIEVEQAVQQGQDRKEALNGFMKRVMGSIDR